MVEVVGEEDDTCEVNIATKPFTVGAVEVPSQYDAVIERARDMIDGWIQEVPEYSDITCFIDPIDGTKEFTTQQGEQCSICIGFADSFGSSVGGIIYRPIAGTWAAGAEGEGYKAGNLDKAATNDAVPGFLTSNGGISPFIEELISVLDLPRVRAGGAGNKALLLLEGKGSCYIQDRGVSRLLFAMCAQYLHCCER